MTRRVFLAACLGIAVAQWAASATASGREGEGLVGAVQLVVNVVLVALAASLLAGVAWGGYKAGQKGESVLKGGAIGIWKGFLGFLVLAAASSVTLTVVGILWIAYAFLSTGRIDEFLKALQDAWNMP
jgi:hypothetical protein